MPEQKKMCSVCLSVSPVAPRPRPRSCPLVVRIPPGPRSASALSAPSQTLSVGRDRRERGVAYTTPPRRHDVAGPLKTPRDETSRLYYFVRGLAIRYPSGLRSWHRLPGAARLLSSRTHERAWRRRPAPRPFSTTPPSSSRRRRPSRVENTGMLACTPSLAAEVRTTATSPWG